MKPERFFVLFRVDANSEIGAGHLMRCLALAHAFKQADIGSHFLVDAATAALISSLPAFEFEFSALNASASDLSDIQAILSRLEHAQICLALVLDGYQFTAEYRCQLRTLGTLLVVLDEQNNSGELYADIVLNPLSSAQTLNYGSSAPEVMHLFGPDYVLLQPAFQTAEALRWQDRTRLLLTFGASDIKDLSYQIVAELLNTQTPLSQLTLVTGAAYPREQALRQTLASLDKATASITYLHNVQNMAEVMQDCRLAISAAGGTQFELATMQVPSLLVVVADNQFAAAKEQEAQGWCQVIDARHGLDVPALIRQATALWQDAERLFQMHQQAAGCSYKWGAQRVVRAVRQAYTQRAAGPGINAYGVNLEPVSRQDLEMIRHWRNDPSVRQFMLDQTEISEERQQQWFARIAHDVAQRHFVISFRDQPIGVINLKSSDQGPLFQAAAIEIGLYIYAARYRNNFLAFCPSLAMIDYCFEVLQCAKILASVLPDNQAAINYNRQLGYTLQTNAKGDKGLLQMQLEPSGYQTASRKIKTLIRYP